jgi:KDO2-lipid IV(A) lauroyltransferase
MSFFITKFIEFFLFILGLIPINAVSRLPWWNFFTKRALVNSDVYRTTKINLELAFPELSGEELKLLTKRSVVETLQTFGEIGFAWSWLPKKDLKKYIVEKGLINAQKSLDKKRGLILFTPHLSNIEVMLNCVTRNFPCMVLYSPSKNKYFDKVMLEARSKMGAEMVEPNIAGVKAILGKLKQGGVVLIAGDQVPNLEGGLLANFFSVPALTMTLVSKLKLKTGAPCLSVFCVRKPGDLGFEVAYSEEIDGMDLDMQSSVDRMNVELEKCIMIAPEQYAWEYKRYKHSGQKNIY